MINKFNIIPSFSYKFTRIVYDHVPAIITLPLSKMPFEGEAIISTCSGSANFVRKPSDSNHFEYHESGSITFALNNITADFEKGYLYIFANDPNGDTIRLNVFFTDTGSAGKQFFSSTIIETHDNSNNVEKGNSRHQTWYTSESEIFHTCVDDLYRGKMEWSVSTCTHAESDVLVDWWTLWAVTGPAKRYTIVTHYRSNQSK